MSDLCDPIDSSLPGSAIPGILQARTLEWVAISFSNAWKWKVKAKSLSCVRLLATPWTTAYQAPLSMEFSRQKYWSGVPLLSPIEATKKYKIFDNILYIYVFCEELSRIREIVHWLKVQFSHSVVSDSWDPMDCTSPGFPVHHQLPEPTQTYAHRVDDAIQLSHPLLSPSPPALNLPQH